MCERAGASNSPGPSFFCPYSPNVVEGEFPEDPQAPICACYDGRVFLGVQRPRTQTRSSRRSCVTGTSRRGIMQIRIARTREDQEPRERDCTICRDVFWLGEATAWAITDENTLIGEVCPACLEGGASHIEAKLEERARLSRVIAEQDERIASESVEDVPSVDELLVAETFYGGRGGAFSTIFSVSWE